jgi:hypothetical protein
MSVTPLADTFSRVIPSTYSSVTAPTQSNTGALGQDARVPRNGIGFQRQGRNRGRQTSSLSVSVTSQPCNAQKMPGSPTPQPNSNTRMPFTLSRPNVDKYLARKCVRTSLEGLTRKKSVLGFCSTRRRERRD